MTHRRTATQRDYEQRILRVLVHIQRHLDEPLDLARLAAVAGFSPFHFHRIFRGMVGEPVKAHVRRLRLERAAHRLKHGADAVTELAFDAGYDSLEAFSRAFSRRFGAPPSSYRGQRPAVAPSGVHYAADTELEGFAPLTMESDTMEAEVRHIDPLQVVFVRHTGPYDQVGAAWGQLCGWAGPAGLLGPQTRTVGVSYDDPEVTPPDKLRYDACLVVDRPIDPAGNVGVQTVGNRDYAVATHSGPYEDLALTYSKLIGRWMPAQGLEPASDVPCLEFYLNDPQTTPPEQLRTEICVPVR